MPRKLSINISLMVLMSLSEGVSILLLVPLLQLVGLNMGVGSLNQIASTVSNLFLMIGIKPTLPLVLGIYIVVVSISAILSRSQMMLNYDIDFQFAAYMRKRLYQAITYSNWLFFSQKRSSIFAHALTNEVERIGTGTSQFLTLLAGIMILAVYIILALKLAGLFTGVIFLVGVVLLLILRNKAYSSRSRGEDITYSTRDVYSSIMQHLDGMKTIKSFGMQKENVKEFSHLTDQVVHSYLDSIQSYADVKLLFDIGTVIILAIIVLVLIETVQITAASLLILIYLFARMVPQFSTVQGSYQYTLNMLPAYKNVTDLENQCLENSEPLEFEMDGIELKKEITLENVSFSYQDDDHFALNDVDIRIVAGNTTAIAGASGAGKTTIADLVMGFIKPTNGYVTMDGAPIPKSWKNKIGYVAQETFLFNESVKFNLLIARPEANQEELTNALKMAAAYDFVSKLPDGLDTILGDRGVRLSGGEKQRLALARALIKIPSLLILDEATSNLDSENEKRIMNAIEDLHGEITILIIAHRVSTIKNTDYIYLIDEGRIIDSGTWNELLEKEDGYLRNICLAQGVKP